MERVLVFGMAQTGRAVAAACRQRGIDVVTADDRAVEGVSHVAPRGQELARLVRSVDTVLPAPGVPERHPVIGEAIAQGRPVRTELDVAAEWEAQRPGGARPLVAITGTDGKTTTTTLTLEVLRASGVRAVDAGNNDLPLVTAIDDASTEVFVVEASSFRLRWLTRFAPHVGTWINLAPDHLDWHGDLEHYIAAKARLWEYQSADDIAVANLHDDTVMAATAGIRARVVTFGGPGSAADWRVERDHLVGPDGPFAAVGDLWRSMPHDLTNALAAVATAMPVGATIDGVTEALRAFRGVKHRIELLADVDGVRWYDDSKATTPHAALTALRGFASVVLIAGGRNKDLDLTALAGDPHRMRHVIGIGESGGEVVAAFAGVCPAQEAHSMDEAVAMAHAVAQPGDAVLLSPACASFDWYRDYAHRGDDFARAVRERLGR